VVTQATALRPSSLDQPLKPRNSKRALELVDEPATSEAAQPNDRTAVDAALRRLFHVSGAFDVTVTRLTRARL
jgi:hypothetical protein